MQIYRLTSPVWISKNMICFFFLQGSSRNLNLLIPEGCLPFRDFLFLFDAGAWFRLLSLVCGSFIGAGGGYLSLSVDFEGGGAWAVCGAVRRFFLSGIGLTGYSHSRMQGQTVLFLLNHRTEPKNIRGADSPDVFSAPLDMFWGNSVTLSRLSLTLYSCSDTLSCYLLTVPPPPAYKVHGIICHCHAGVSGGFPAML